MFMSASCSMRNREAATRTDILALGHIAGHNPAQGFPPIAHSSHLYPSPVSICSHPKDCIIFSIAISRRTWRLAHSLFGGSSHSWRFSVSCCSLLSLCRVMLLSRDCFRYCPKGTSSQIAAIPVPHFFPPPPSSGAYMGIRDIVALPVTSPSDNNIPHINCGIVTLA